MPIIVYRQTRTPMARFCEGWTNNILRFFSLTKGTDQNCLVLNHLLNFQPKTKVNTPKTNLNLTEFKYKVLTGNDGAP